MAECILCKRPLKLPWWRRLMFSKNVCPGWPYECYVEYSRRCFPGVPMLDRDEFAEAMTDLRRRF